MSTSGTLITCEVCGATFLHGLGHRCSRTAIKAWDMEHVNRMNIPPSEGALGVVFCPTEGCGAILNANGPCYRCGWVLIVTRKEVESNG